ncbi:MAG: GNAT family N-acetyltransferase [Planctomycetes bacterium]|nr:GNAT family N-acetyltransferase [Planctomycetota bacterium]
MTTATRLVVTELDRDGIRPWLPALDDWLLPGSIYSVHHTWPLLYRSDGHGRFFAVFDGDRLISHCATRRVTIVGGSGPFEATLLGSVATDPEYRGQGLAGQILTRALGAAATECDHVLLWAERPDLYRAHGFADGRDERCLLLARTPKQSEVRIRLATVADHPILHRLHCSKPWRIERTLGAMSGLLTTPGMTTLVLERDDAIVAYACCGKGADLAGHWHEVGGSDRDVAELLRAALHFTDQIEAVLLLPPYRPRLRELLGRSAVEEFVVTGPMAHSPRAPLPACWIDGLDSV